MNVYRCSNYKDVLRESVENSRSQVGARFTYQGMALHCRVQKTYLSKVLNRDGHLSEDQLYLALDYLGLDEDERDFTLLLMAWEKSSVGARREKLAQRIKALRTSKTKTETQLKVKTTEPQAQDLAPYYLDPIYQVIHMHLTLKRFNQEPMRIAESLNLKPNTLKRYLKSLAAMDIIRLTENKGEIQRAVVIKDNMHLPQDSVLHGAYSLRMRLRALERMDALEKDEAYRFSVIFSTSPKVREQIHNSFIEWLNSVQRMVQGNREEQVYQMNFDLLNWT